MEVDDDVWRLMEANGGRRRLMEVDDGAQRWMKAYEVDDGKWR